MKLLLDTHAVLWWLLGDDRLPDRARSAIADEDAQVLVSAASGFEIATKHRIGKLPGAAPIAGVLAALLPDHGFQELPISLAHAERAGLLAIEHKDPFDRLLIAQAQIENASLVSNEALFDGFGVDRIWS
jgi:PIN domain nuclease of toxin-antitoxin system